MLTAADQIERRAIGGRRQGKLGVLVLCIIELFHQIFYKGLFTQVTVFETFFALQIVSALVQFAMFPVRMSRAFFAVRTAFFRKFDPSNHLLSSLLGEVGGADVSIETYRHDLTVEFCAVSMAQRIAGTMFLVGLFIVRFTPNGEFLKLSNLDKDEYDQLVVFTLVVQIPTFVTGKMSYVDIGWPMGLVVLAANLMLYGPASLERRLVVGVPLMLHGGRMFLGALAMFFPYVFKEDLSRYQYAKVSDVVVCCGG